MSHSCAYESLSMHWAYRSMGVRPQGGTSPTLTVSKVYAKKASAYSHSTHGRGTGEGLVDGREDEEDTLRHVGGVECA